MSKSREFEDRLDRLIKSVEITGEPAIEWLSNTNNNLLVEETQDLTHGDLIRLLNKAVLAINKQQWQMSENERLWEQAGNVTGAMAYVRGNHEEKSIRSSKAGKARAANNESHIKLNAIVEDYKYREQGGYNFNISGRLTLFYEEMQSKYDIPFSSIKRRIENYRRKNKTS